MALQSTNARMTDLACSFKEYSTNKSSRMDRLESQVEQLFQVSNDRAGSRSTDEPAEVSPKNPEATGKIQVRVLEDRLRVDAADLRTDLERNVATSIRELETTSGRMGSALDQRLADVSIQTSGETRISATSDSPKKGTRNEEKKAGKKAGKDLKRLSGEMVSLDQTVGDLNSEISKLARRLDGLESTASKENGARSQSQSGPPAQSASAPAAYCTFNGQFFLEFSLENPEMMENCP